MLEKLDLKKTADEGTYDKSLASLKERLGVLQRTLRDQDIPTVIVFEGWNAAGITMSVHEIVQALDPRGYALHAIEKPTEEERARPFLWRFWLRTPPRGRMGLFARSWYSRAISEEMQKHTWVKSLKGRAHQINVFERMLHDDGTVILKFFLHISKEEQKMRLEERERNPLTAWLVTPSIWNVHRHYDDSLPLIDEFIEKTNTDYAPWTLVEATDRKYAILKIYSMIVRTLEKRTGAEEKETKHKKARPKDLPRPRKSPVKRHSSPAVSFTKEECQQTLANLQIEMLELHYLLFKRKIPLMVAYEGWDAAGKGGNITRVTRYMNPLGYYVVPVSAPTEHEKDYHYLRRFIKHFPTGGDIAIFDRSWYGRVLVERVEKFCSESDWQRAYDEINDMEEDFIYSSGGGIIKFWLEISKEALKRFQQRASDPQKIYKITEEDWRNREKWDLYNDAVDDMLARTSTEIAPWTIIESDDKWFARVKALKTVITTAQNLL